MVPKFFVVLLVAACTMGHAARGEPGSTAEARALPAPDADGFITLFNGHDLAGWEGLADYWSVRDGGISGHQTKEVSKQTFLVLSGLTVGTGPLRRGMTSADGTLRTCNGRGSSRPFAWDVEACPTAACQVLPAAPIGTLPRAGCPKTVAAACRSPKPDGSNG